MKLVLEKPAIKALARLQPKTRDAILAALERIASAPFGRHPQARRLAGTRAGYRLRHGDWRALYRIDRATGTVYVENVLSRGGAYR